MALSTAGRVVLGLVTLFLLASMGGAGIVASPILLPLLFVAAVRSGRLGRVVFSVLAGLVALEAVWALLYVTIGEAHAVMWAVPFVAFAVAVVYFRVSGLGLDDAAR